MKSIFFVAIASASLSLGCSRIDLMAASIAPYFQEWDHVPHRLDQIGAGVFVFEAGIDRALVLETHEGIVVFDSFSEEIAKEMAAAIAERFPTKRITHLIYSHNHSDHTRGGAVLEPAEVWAHENTAWHFERYNHKKEILPPTRYLPAGDQTLHLGGMTIELLDFKNAHAEHLYGVFLPAERIFFGTDLAFCRTLPPLGFPDWNYAGLVEALERTEATNFETYVPSHFDRGTKACVSEYKGLIVDARRAALNAFEKYGLPQNEAAWFSSVLKDMQAELEPKYKDWHGWDEMGLILLQRNLSGTYLGF